MFRVTRAPVVVLAGVDVKINGQAVTVKGKSDELTRTLNGAVEIKHAGSTLAFSSCDGYTDSWIQVGTAYVLPDSIVIGVTGGFTKKLQLISVSYRVTIEGNIIDLSLDFSHPVDHQLPAGVIAEYPTQTEIMPKDADKQVIGQAAADLRAYRRPEPYEGKSVRYVDETVHTKEAKKEQDSTMDKRSARIRRATRACCKFQELDVAHLVVHHVPRHAYTQIITPNGSEVLVIASTIEKTIAEQLKYTGNKGTATTVGKAIAECALEKGIKGVSFDRSGLQYHGYVQALAGAARKAGLQF